ncbi:MAG: hypothetical protein AB7F84_11025 [Hyphomonadaceae bacterium]
MAGRIQNSALLEWAPDHRPNLTRAALCEVLRKQRELDLPLNAFARRMGVSKDTLSRYLGDFHVRLREDPHGFIAIHAATLAHFARAEMLGHQTRQLSFAALVASEPGATVLAKAGMLGDFLLLMQIEHPEHLPDWLLKIADMRITDLLPPALPEPTMRSRQGDGITFPEPADKTPATASERSATTDARPRFSPLAEELRISR